MVLEELFRAGQELLLDGSYDITAASLKIALCDGTYTSLGLDTSSITYSDLVDTSIVRKLTITSQAWSWDPDTRTLVLVPSGSIGWTPSGIEVFRYGVLYDAANNKAPFAQFTWPSDQSAAASVAHTLTIPALLRNRLYSSLTPTPVGIVGQPVILQDVDGVNWRVVSTSTTLATIATSETDPREDWLTSADTTLWQLVVDNTGVVTASNVGSPSPGARIFDDTNLPCKLPETTSVSTPKTLSVSNTGVLSVA